MVRLDNCPACGNNSYENLVDFGDLPRSGIFLKSPEDPYDIASLSFDFCPRCALIKRKFSRSESFNYTHVDRETCHRLPDYASQLVEALHKNKIKKDSLIIEVGANDGAFLDILTQSGFIGCVGVEPSHVCAEKCRSKGHTIKETHLNRQESANIRDTYGAASAVICRHTLEHVPDPKEFLLALRDLLGDDGILFIEVPDARSIIYDLKGHELWDEHLYSFTPDNLTLLMNKVGFQINEVMTVSHRDTRNIFLCCTSGSSKGESHDMSVTLHSDDVLGCRAFSEKWTLFSEKMLSKISSMEKPIACIGASHPQTNFLLFTGLGQHIDVFIDDDAAKVGRFVPVPQPVRVLSTEQVLSDPWHGTAIRGAFGYTGWMDKVCEGLGVKEVNIFKPYSHFPGLIAAVEGGTSRL